MQYCAEALGNLRRCLKAELDWNFGPGVWGLRWPHDKGAARRFMEVILCWMPGKFCQPTYTSVHWEITWIAMWPVQAASKYFISPWGKKKLNLTLECMQIANSKNIKNFFCSLKVTDILLDAYRHLNTAGTFFWSQNIFPEPGTFFVFTPQDLGPICSSSEAVPELFFSTYSRLFSVLLFKHILWKCQKYTTSVM